MLRKKLGPLEVLELNNSTSADTVIMLHGYGADAHDLAGIAHFHTRFQQLNWIFPDAPLSLPALPFMAGGRAWFPIDMIQLQTTMMSGKTRIFADQIPDGLEHASQLILQMLQALDQPLEKVYLAGFSQGAMIALDAALTLPAPVAGVALFSTVLTAEKRWQNLIAYKDKLRLMQSHGRQDSTLPYSEGQALYQLLADKFGPYPFVSFNGGHEIPVVALDCFQNFLLEQEK